MPGKYAGAAAMGGATLEGGATADRLCARADAGKMATAERTPHPNRESVMIYPLYLAIQEAVARATPEEIPTRHCAPLPLQRKAWQESVTSNPSEGIDSARRENRQLAKSHHPLTMLGQGIVVGITAGVTVIPGCAVCGGTVINPRTAPIRPSRVWPATRT